MNAFDQEMTQHQVQWRRANVKSLEPGYQNGRPYPWILPPRLWEEGLWPGIRSGSLHSLPAYLAANGIEKHTGAHNLKSSWVLCANLYFPFGRPEGLDILTGFLRAQVSPLIESVVGVELEFALPFPLDPQALLGEPEGGRRGANQTSPDVAFLVRTSGGRGLILTENKLVEHSFYPCSGRKRSAQNRHPSACLDWPGLQASLRAQCWQLHWGDKGGGNRRYWDHFKLSEKGRAALRQCPAATAGYQLFRQQALAEAIADSGEYDLIVSCVAYDARNDTLRRCLRPTGVEDFSTGWGPLLEGKAQFRTFTHQEWVSWVRSHDAGGRWTDYLRYVEGRYDLAPARDGDPK